MSDCRFGVSPVNYPDPDPDRNAPFQQRRSIFCASIMSQSQCDANRCYIPILTQTPNATRNGAKFDRSLFCRKTSMIYVGQLPSTNLLGTLIPFFRLWLTELSSDWSKGYFRDFHAF